MITHYILISYIVGSFPLLALVLKLFKKYGTTIAVLSPISIFFIAYSLFSLVRPFLYLKFGTSYIFTSIKQSDYILSLFIISICNWFFCLGYIIAIKNKRKNIVYKFKKQPTPLILILIVTFLFLAYYHAISNGLLSLDFGSNRTNYLISLQGFGYVSLFYGSPGFYLLWYYCVWEKNLRVIFFNYF